jgi:hypothetical protein
LTRPQPGANRRNRLYQKAHALTTSLTSPGTATGRATTHGDLPGAPRYWMPVESQEATHTTRAAAVRLPLGPSRATSVARWSPGRQKRGRRHLCRMLAGWWMPTTGAPAIVLHCNSPPLRPLPGRTSRLPSWGANAMHACTWPALVPMTRALVAGAGVVIYTASAPQAVRSPMRASARTCYPSWARRTSSATLTAAPSWKFPRETSM